MPALYVSSTLGFKLGMALGATRRSGGVVISS
jgi:hypothetical protein